MKTYSKQSAFTLIELLVVITIIAILAGIALPVYNTVTERGQQTKALAHAKEIGLACKIFALDYDGSYPNLIDPNDNTSGEATTANEALATLVPDYVPNETLFSVTGSGWTPNGADNQIDDPPVYPNVETLAAGDNHWGYIRGLRDTSNPSFPLLADGWADSTPGVYPNPSTASEGDPGFVWKSKKAIVIRTDTSGAVENVDRTNNWVNRGEGDAAEQTSNLFAQGAGWLSTTTTAVLNPE